MTDPVSAAQNRLDEALDREKAARAVYDAKFRELEEAQRAAAKAVSELRKMQRDAEEALLPPEAKWENVYRVVTNNCGVVAVLDGADHVLGKFEDAPAPDFQFAQEVYNIIDNDSI